MPQWPTGVTTTYTYLASSGASNIKAVDKSILSIDKDRTVCQTIKSIAESYNNSYELALATGGDQNNDTIPERQICDQMTVAHIDGLGDKIQSSSWLLKKIK